nr:hypothetical protein [Nostoc sp. MG11]
MRQEHDEDVLGHNHAGGSFVSELRIKLEAELSKELDRLIEVFDWQIDENLCTHGLSF